MPYFGGTAQRTDPKFLIDRLMKNRYSRMQASAIVGNLQHESGLVSNNMNKDEGAYGLMQWRGPRFEALQQFAGSQGKPWTDPGVQADFIAHEMQTTERKNVQGFLAAKTIDEASAALKPVIRYGDKSGPERTMHARNFFGANDPGAGAAAPPVQTPQPTVAQPAVSREMYARPATQAVPARGRGLRAGIASLGDFGAAYIDRDRRLAAAGQPSGLAALGNALSGAGQQMADPRAGIAATVAGQQPSGASAPVDLGTQTGDPVSYQPVMNAPPGAAEPLRFPGGGIPMPRSRPQTGPGMMQGDFIYPTQSVADLGSVVDPMRYDYG